MPHNDFYDVDHANLRLSNTIIRLGNYPIYLTEVYADWSASVTYLHSGKGSVLSDIRTLKDFDISPVPLGFCNAGSTASYLMRMPRRRTKQGLSEDSIAFHDGNRQSVRQNGAYAKALSNTINGVYPAKKEALSMLAKGFYVVAISRNWALARDVGGTYLHYKYYGVVGKLIENEIYSLNPDFNYLQESLDQEIGNA